MKNDPKKYCEMQRHRPVNEVNASVQAFWEDVNAARDKHQIADVLVCYAVNTEMPDGQCGTTRLYGYIGDSIKAEQMAGFALGQAQANRQQALYEAIGEAATVKKPKSGF